MLTRQEMNVAGKLFEGLEERQACRFHNMSYERLVKLYENEEFVRYLEVLFKKCVKQSEIELAGYGVKAVRKLGLLLVDGKDEVAMKAAVDILNRCQDVLKKIKLSEGETQQPGCELSEEEAREMLYKLAGSNVEQKVKEQ